MKKSLKFLLCLLHQLAVHYFMLFNLRKYLERFFVIWLMIHRGASMGSKILEHDKVAKYLDNPAQFRAVSIGVLYLISATTVVRAMQFLAFALVPNWISDHWRHLLWDQMYLLGVDPFISLLYFAYVPTCTLIYLRMYYYQARTEWQKRRESIWLVYQSLNNVPDQDESRFECEDDRKLIHVDQGRIHRLANKLCRINECYNYYLGMKMTTIVCKT